MYEYVSPRSGRAWPYIATLLTTTVLCMGSTVSHAQQASPISSVVRNIARANERIEMTVNTSQILTLGTRIPRLVVNNPELVTATPISETQIQIAARKPGVTQINLWDENGQIFTVDLLIFGDVRELEMVLKQMFPASTLKVTRLTNSLVLNGQVDRPEIVSTIRALAEDYAPKVVNNITVGGVQQVILKVKVMEVSRTKLRKLGMDFAIFGKNGFFASSVSDLIQNVTTNNGSVTTSGGETIDFGIVGHDVQFFGIIDALQRNNVSKVLADPTLVTVSGRPASFLVGGQIPVPVPQGLNQITIQYKDFGTQVDFVPIVLGGGRMRLEVRPRLSELDYSNSVSIQGTTVPALRVRQVDTGVEMNAGQTLALAGLIQERIDSAKRGLPYVMDLPVIGVPFRKVEETVNEIESLVLVTPDFVDAMDPHEVPQCGPGMETMSPSNEQLYWKGMIEVPSCGPCGASDPCSCNAPGLRCQDGACGPGTNGMYGGPNGPAAMATDGMPLGGVPMDGGEMVAPTPADPTLPTDGATGPAMEPIEPGADPSARQQSPPWQRTAAAPSGRSILRHRADGATPVVGSTSTPGLIGPIGYDVQK